MVSGRSGVDPAPAHDASLVEAVHALYAAWGRTDAAWIPEFIADDPRVLLIGTDATEWWVGFESIRTEWTRARAAYGGTSLSATRLVAHSHDGLGWAADEAEYRLGSGQTGRFRLTMVFIERDARWLLLHMHASIAVPNERITPA